MASALSKTVARCSLGYRRSFTATPPYPTFSMSTCPANRLSNLVIMAWPPVRIADRSSAHSRLGFAADNPLRSAPGLSVRRRDDGHCHTGSTRSASRHIVDRHRLAQTLQREVADLLQCNGRLDRRGNALAEQNLAVARLAAEPCREVGDGANRGVVDSFLKT